MKEFSCAFWNVLSSWKIWSPKKIVYIIKIIKTLVNIDFLITNVDDFPGFIPWPAFLGGPGSHFYRQNSPVRNPPKSGRWRRSSSRSTKRKSRCHRLYQEPPVVSSCIVARCNLCLVDGFFRMFFPYVFAWWMKLVVFLDCQELIGDLYFSWYFCSKRSPPFNSGDHGSGWSQLHLDYEDGQGGSPSLGRVTLEFPT